MGRRGARRCLGAIAGEFVHLHVHSEYSLLDGCAPARVIPEQAAALGMRAVALTDHGVLHGAVQFTRAANEAGVKPILGCELYVVADDAPGEGGSGSYHLTALALDEGGYRNLCALSTLGFLEGFYYRPRVTKEQLVRYREGLVILSGCLAAEVPSLLARDRYDEARRVAAWFRDHFGPEGYYLELMDHGLEVQAKVNAGLLRLHRELGIDVVATNDAHYLTREEAAVQDVLVCIQTGRRLDEADRLRFESDRLHLASPAEMEALFGPVPGALRNTLAIAERVDFAVDRLAVSLPAFPDAAAAGGGARLLREAVYRGLAARYGPELSAEVRGRVEHELAIIAQTGFTDYFLIVWDLVRHARSRGIAVGPGRGSSASSVVAYALEITDVDPLAHGLLFERFLNPERVTMPDIDIDFCFERRHEVIAYAAERYGPDRVAQIATFGTLAARAAVRDVGRVLGLPYAEVDRIARLIPGGPGVTLERALQEVPELRAAARESEAVRRLLEAARRVEGKPRHLSVHAAGIVIAPEPLARSIPLCKTSDGAVVTQYAGEDLEALGFLKMDLLGLRTLTVIDKAAALVREGRGVELDLRRLPLEDRSVYAMLGRGETEGVFQLETGMFQGLLREVRPESFADLVAILALGRPGPMARLDDYLRHRRGEAEPAYVHPALREILEETCGVMLYQEQVMQIASAVAGYTPGEADLLRRAMGKKLPEIMAAERRRFVEAAARRGLAEAAAAGLFDEIARFAEYGFPKSHSAAYALVAYQTAYLKVHYPAEFMAALLSSLMHATDRAGRYLEECRRLGIAVLGPDVNESAVDFTVRDGGIRFGLGAVKHVGRALAAEIVARRGSTPFRSLEDFCARMPSSSLNRKALESLIRVGAFASTGTTRRSALARLDAALRAKGRPEEAEDQVSLFDGTGEGTAAPVPAAEPGDELRIDEMLADEIELLGTYVTASPFAPYREVLQAFPLPAEPGAGLRPVVGGAVVAVRANRARDGQAMAFVTLEDVNGSRCEVVLFPRVYAELQGLRPGGVLVAGGRLEEDEAGMKLIAESARMLEGEPLEIAVDDVKALAPLRRRLQERRGGRPVVLRLEGSRASARLVLPPRFWVSRDFS